MTVLYPCNKARTIKHDRLSEKAMAHHDGCLVQ